MKSLTLVKSSICHLVFICMIVYHFPLQSVSSPRLLHESLSSGGQVRASVREEDQMAKEILKIFDISRNTINNMDWL